MTQAHPDDAITNFMTRGVHTIAHDRTLNEAHEVMRSLKVRHLPVLEGGKLKGLVSVHDLDLVETLRDTDPSKVTVADAMSEDVFVVEPETPLAAVAQRLVHERLGSAVVMRGPAVVGIFTAVDALRALDFMLSSPRIKSALREAMIPQASGPRS